jgi:hypothetical protein
MARLLHVRRETGVFQMTIPIDTFTIEDLQSMRDRAWRQAARCWQEYHAAVRDGEPLAVTNLLNADAWSAERDWRHLYELVREREAGR